MALWNASFINAVPLFDLRWVLIHSRTIRVLYSKESPSLLDKALIAQNKALPTVLLPESLIPVMTVKPPTSIEACLILFYIGEFNLHRLFYYGMYKCNDKY